MGKRGTARRRVHALLTSSERSARTFDMAASDPYDDVYDTDWTAHKSALPGGRLGLCVVLAVVRLVGGFSASSTTAVSIGAGTAMGVLMQCIRGRRLSLPAAVRTPMHLGNASFASPFYCAGATLGRLSQRCCGWMMALPLLAGHVASMPTG